MSTLILLQAASPIMELVTDPASPNGGDVWFNTTDQVYRLYDFDSYGAGVWSSSISRLVSDSGDSGDGEQDSFLSVGGTGAVSKDHAYLYDGITWSDEGLPGYDSRYGMAVGNPLDFLHILGGNTGGNTVLCYLYDGVAWSSTGSTVVICRLGAEAGTPSDCLIFSGSGISTQLFDGTTWSNLSLTSSTYGAGSGVSSNSVINSNIAGAATSKTFDGTTWSAISDDLLTRVANPVGFGSQDDYVVVGVNLVAASEYDGSSWSAAALSPNLISYNSAAGHVSSSGHITSNSSNSYKYDKPTNLFTKDIVL